MAFFPVLPYTPHKVTPHFVEVCLRFVQTTVFLLPFIFFSSSRQSFINAYKLYFVLDVYIAHANVELVSVLSSFICYLLRLLENQA